MESTEIIIAKLVLGYLKIQKHTTAYNEFLRNSNHLQQISHSQSKYLSTRLFGLNLEEILKEYFEIYQIVQGRLEATNYFNEKHLNRTLVQQVEYLLWPGYSNRTSMPCTRSPCESRLDEISYDDHTSEVEAMPAHTLPRNMHHSKDVPSASTPKNKLQSKKHSPNDQADVSADVTLNNKCLGQTKELLEKIVKALKNTADVASLNKTAEIVMKEPIQQILDSISDTTQQFHVIPKPVTKQNIMTMPPVITEKMKHPCRQKKALDVHQPPTSLPAPTVSDKVFNVNTEHGFKKVIYLKRRNPELSNTAISSTMIPDLSVTTEQRTNTTIPPISKRPVSCMPVGDQDVMKTPPPLNNVQKVTSKSSSHNLDFSTPTKITSSVKNPSKSQQLKSPLNKQASESLFSTDSDNYLTSSSNGVVPKANKLRTDLEKNDISASDCEAQKYVEGLKEQVIHVMHKKSPKKKTEDFVQNNMQTSVTEIISEDFKIEPATSGEKSPKILEDVFDTVQFDTETVHIIFDEILFYITAQKGKEILVTLTTTPFYDIFHFEPEVQSHDCKSNEKKQADVKTFPADNNEKNTTSEGTNDKQNIKKMRKYANHKYSMESHDSENYEVSSRRNSKMNTSSDNIDSITKEIEVSNTTNKVPNISKKLNIMNNTNNIDAINSNVPSTTIEEKEIANKCSNVFNYTDRNKTEGSIKTSKEQSSDNCLCSDNNFYCEVSDKSSVKKDSNEVSMAKKSITTEIPSNIIKIQKNVFLSRSVETKRSVASILPPENEDNMFSIEQSVLQKRDIPSCDIIWGKSDNYIPERNALPPKLRDDDL